MMTALTLPQSLLLLTLSDEEGKLKGGYYKTAIAGAAVSELLLRGLLIHDEKPKSLIRLSGPTRTESRFLNMCLELIVASPKEKSMKHWVSKLGNKKDIVKDLAEELVEMGVLHQENSKILGLFNRTVWPEKNGRLERELKSEMARVMFSGALSEDARIGVIIALASHAGLLGYNFDKADLKAHKARIKDLASGKTLASKATAEVIQSIQMALIVTTVIVPIVAT